MRCSALRSCRPAVSNTEQFDPPMLAFIPPEEALLRFLLWLALAVTIPVAAVIMANLLTGRDPGLLLRGALAERLRAAARFCEGQPGAERQLTALALEDTADLLKLRHLSGLFHRASQPAPVEEIQRLVLLLAAVKRIGEDAEWRVRLIPLAQFCEHAAQALTDGAMAFPPAPNVDLAGAAQPLGEANQPRVASDVSIRPDPDIRLRGSHGGFWRRTPSAILTTPASH